MDLAKLAAPFPADDVEWKPISPEIGRDGRVGVLAYITARAVMQRLDDVCGPENWQVEYDIQPSGVLCELSVYVDEHWVRKVDGAEPTAFEPFKGGLSSSFKRAGVVWGIGRYLYQLDTTRTPARAPRQNEKIPVGWRWADGIIFEIPALPSWALPTAQPNQKARKPAQEPAPAPGGEDEPRPLTDAQLRKIGALRRGLELSDEAFENGLMAHYRIKSAEALDGAQATDLIERLEAKRKAQLEREVEEAFGGDGRLGQLRQQALGFCRTVGRMGARFLDGSPVDFPAEGLVVENVLELEEVVGAIADEKELEAVILKLEALLEKMSF